MCEDVRWMSECVVLLQDHGQGCCQPQVHLLNTSCVCVLSYLSTLMSLVLI